MAITEIQCRNAKPKDKAYRLYDANYLYLEVTPTGSKLWRMVCKTRQKTTTRALGKYPKVSLKEARTKRDELLSVIHETGDLPQKGGNHASNSFEAIARQWVSVEKAGWSERHFAMVTMRLENYLIPYIGHMDIATIDPETVFNAIKIQIDGGKFETAKRARGVASQVFDFAIALGKSKFNPAQSIRKLMPKIRAKSFFFLEAPEKIGAFLLAMDEYEGEEYIRIGLQLLPLFFVRPGNLRFAEWTEFDFDAAVWLIPAAKMKGRQDHIVPLAKQALDCLKALKGVTGYSDYLFPSARSKNRPISDNTFSAAYKRCGYTSNDIVPHGCRHMASTKLHEMGFRTEVIEKQMAHTDQNKIRATYNKAEYLPERVKMMQQWADKLDEFRALVRPKNSF